MLDAADIEESKKLSRRPNLPTQANFKCF